MLIEVLVVLSICDEVGARRTAKLLPELLVKQVEQEMFPAPDKEIGPVAETATVPEASGRVMVFTPVGSATAMVVVNPLSVAPWNTSGEPPRS